MIPLRGEGHGQGQGQTATLESLAAFDDVLLALADPTRRAVLERLAQAGEGTATTLAAGLPITRQAVLKHLTHLDQAQLVAAQKRGREVRYRVQPERLLATARGLEAVAQQWDRTLFALKRIAEAAEALESAPQEQKSERKTDT